MPFLICERVGTQAAGYRPLLSQLHQPGDRLEGRQLGSKPVFTRAAGLTGQPTAPQASPIPSVIPDRVSSHLRGHSWPEAKTPARHSNLGCTISTRILKTRPNGHSDTSMSALSRSQNSTVHCCGLPGRRGPSKSADHLPGACFAAHRETLAGWAAGKWGAPTEGKHPSALQEAPQCAPWWILPVLLTP